MQKSILHNMIIFLVLSLTAVARWLFMRHSRRVALTCSPP
jgi:hypothetical protein